jgi:thiol-disulfide isomerase/thioredoxin
MDSNKMVNRIIVLFIIIVFVIGCKSKRDSKEHAAKPERVFEKIRLQELNGKKLSLDEYAGKTIFIHFWATWCKPCIKEMPAIIQAENLLQNENVIFLMASGETVEEIETFKNSHDYNFNYVRVENSEELNVQALPTTFIFNSKGDLAFSETGSRDWNKKNNIDLILKISKQ